MFISKHGFIGVVAVIGVGGTSMDWSRENLAGVNFDRRWKLFLLPGMIILWCSYMFPDSGRTGAARRARSPIMTVMYSIAFYLLIGFLVIGSAVK